MTTRNSTSTVTENQLQLLLLAVSKPTRWRMLQELLKGEALPVAELAKRVGIAMANASKHVHVLLAAGIVERTYNRAYRIRAPYIGADGTSIDLGPFLLRLDRLKTS
jgi:predicted transcriptional regulator